MANTVQLKADISGAGTPILLLHGFPDSRKMWRTITPYFIENNYQVIAPDMRGFGDSPMPTRKQDYKIALIIADIVELLKANNITQPIYVMGHWFNKYCLPKKALWEHIRCCLIERNCLVDCIMWYCKVLKSD